MAFSRDIPKFVSAVMEASDQLELDTGRAEVEGPCVFAEA